MAPVLAWLPVEPRSGVRLVALKRMTDAGDIIWHGKFDRTWIIWIEARHGLQQEGEVVDAAGDCARMVERPAQREDATAADQPIGRLQAADPTK